MNCSRKTQQPRRGLCRRVYGDASLCLLILLGCSNGEFGRVRPSLVTDNIHAWVGRDAARGYGAPVSLFPLSDDELQLRDYAYPLIEPPYDRHKWYSVLNEWGLTHYFKPEWYHCDPTAYASRLLEAAVRSESARYSRLDEDIRNDITRIPAYTAIAQRVLVTDRKREQSLSYIPVVSGPEVANTKARVAENYLLVAWVQQSLADREAAYRFALERLVLSAPTPAAAIAVERSLSYLHARIVESVLVTPPDFGIANAAPVPAPPGRTLVSK